MTTREAIRALAQRGHSKRRIAEDLGVHRNTVSRYLEEQSPPEAPKCTTPSPGSAPVEGAGSQSEGGGVPSACAPYREFIEAKLAQGLTAKRVWEDLVVERDFAHGYPSVKRFVRRLRSREPERVWRVECAPGEEAQVDCGTVWTRLGGKKRKVHLLRVTLSHSRKGYTEAMARQDTESFVRGIENALRHFGGVPQVLVLDNLKAGVLKPDYYEPELNPKFASFCAHYGVTALPTRPRTPQHKGKVESNIRYVKESAMKAREFDSFAACNRHLQHWERHTADLRIHGTTRKQVGAHFAEVEKPALEALPRDLFPSFVEGKRRVHLDCHVEFEKAYYDVPVEYLSREVWVRCDGRMVHIFNQRMEQIAVHVKLDPGQFSKTLGCGGGRSSIESDLRRWKKKAAEIGPDAGLWARGVIERRGATGLRTLMGLVNSVTRRHDKQAVERACGQARLHGQYRLRDVQRWLDAPAEQQVFSLLTEHELIRDLADYGDLAGFEQDN